jgi:hypothetical protein
MHTWESVVAKYSLWFDHLEFLKSLPKDVRKSLNFRCDDKHLFHDTVGSPLFTEISSVPYRNIAQQTVYRFKNSAPFERI